MKYFYASGYTVMNLKNKEKEMLRRFDWSRLISFYDLDRGNDIMSVVEAFRERQCKERPAEK